MKSILRISWIAAVLLLTAFTGKMFFDRTETEPNNTPAEANPAGFNYNVNHGAIDPPGDVDYYGFTAKGGDSWGFVALLNREDSSISQEAILTAYGTDGVTELASDFNSWKFGSGIALQSYIDGRVPYYLKVNEENNDEILDTYTLEIFETVVNTQPEVEPNDDYIHSQVSAFTMEGTISTSGDKDCYAFHGVDGYVYVLALQSDPENNGGPTNYVLQLYGPGNSLISSANTSTGKKPEFIKTEPLTTEGIYAFCVSELNPADFGAEHTYHVGVMEQGGLYYFDRGFINEWLDPRPGDAAEIGDTMTFKVGVENPGPLMIPGNTSMSVSYDPNCLQFISTSLPNDYSSNGSLGWSTLATNFPANDTIEVTLVFQALRACNDQLELSASFDYYVTGSGKDTPYTILGKTYLPLTLR